MERGVLARKLLVRVRVRLANPNPNPNPNPNQVRQAVQRAAQTSTPQLLRREALARPGCLPPLLLGRLGLGLG